MYPQSVPVIEPSDPALPTDTLPVGRSPIDPLIGASRWHRDFEQRLPLLARQATLMTIVGEAGVGKTHAARAVHWQAATNGEPCRAIDLRRLPPEVVESELFGYTARGLFRRAGHVPGLVAKVGHGTCIVQGIEQLPSAVQERLLPWLVGEAVTPIGDAPPRQFPARIVVELRCPVFPKAKESPVITALYELFAGCVVEIPPLAERRDDILPIAEHYLHLYTEAWGQGACRFGADAARLLRRAPWRENVRGLQRAVASAVLHAPGEVIEADALPPSVAGRAVDAAETGLEGVALEELVEQKLGQFFTRLGSYEVHDLYDTVLEKVERPLLRRVLRRTDGNQVQAARLLGINRNTLRARCKVLGLK